MSGAAKVTARPDSGTPEKFRVWGELCESLATRFADKTAFINVDGKALSFAGFDLRVNRINNALAAQGLRKGDRVAILAKNCTEYAEVYGLAKTGLIVVPLNWRLTPPELLALLHHSAPAAIVVDQQHLPVIAALREQLPSVSVFIALGTAQSGSAALSGWQDYEQLLTAASDARPGIMLAADDVACLMYTSGTTGAPKGVAITQRGILGNVHVSADLVLHLQPEDRTLAAMPMFHAGGMWYHLHPSYAAGCTSVLMAGFDAAQVLRNLALHRITNVHLVPTMINALLADPAIGQVDLQHLRLIFYAASAIPLELLKRALDTFQGCDFIQSYGSTEAGMITDLSASDHVRASSGERQDLLSSCGRPAPGNAIRVAADDGRALAVGEIGEILIRGQSMMSHYWNNPDATEKAFLSGWFCSGDLGYQDQDGYLYLVDRKNDMIVTGGENVYPSEVEAVLRADPEVAMAAVFGVADPVWVERVVASIVLKPGSRRSAAEILAHARQHLAAYKCPKEIHFQQQLPLNAVGKVSKKDLKQAFSNQNQ